MWPFSNAKAIVTPETVPTDTIVPMHSFDDAKFNRAVVLYYTLRFDHVLNPEKLRNSFSRVIERGEWRKLGARLRNSPTRKGKLDYHIPASFNPERPAVAFAQKQFDCSIEDHPTASEIPRSNGKPQVFELPDLADLQRLRKNSPTSLEDYLYSDEPQLSLNVVTFIDATLVTLSWPHTFWDAMGRKAFFTAWMHVLNEEEDQIIPFHGFEEDPLADFGSGASEPYVEAHREFGWLQVIRFVARAIWSKIWYPNDEMKVICLPGSLIQKTKEETAEYMYDAGIKETISSGDALSAHMGRISALHLRPSNRLVCVANALGIRNIVGDAMPTTKAYIANAVLLTMAFVTSRELLTQPLALTVVRVRQALNKQRTRAQAEAFVHSARNLEKRGLLPLWGSGDMQFTIISNHCQGNFFDFDFSAAADKADGPVKASYIAFRLYSNGDFSTRNSMAIAGRDVQGNYWVNPAFESYRWDIIERYVAGLEA